VRRSLVGEIINGARKRTVRRGWLGPEFGWVATLVVMVGVFAAGGWDSRGFFFQGNLPETIPARFFSRCRLSAQGPDEVIRRRGVRTVITFTGGSDRHAWYVDQKRICQARGVELYPFNMRPDQFPTRELLGRLCDLLDHCPRPILVQGNKGIDQSGF